MCPVNKYVGGTPEKCQSCPAMSSSPGGVVRVCPCMDGTGRVSESDPSLPCVGESPGTYCAFCIVECIHSIVSESMYYKLHV